MDTQTASNTSGVQPASTPPDALTMAAVPNVPPIHGSAVAQEPVSYFESLDLDLLAATSPLPDMEFNPSDFDLLSNSLSPASSPANGQNAIPTNSDTPRDPNSSCIKCFRPRPPGSITQEDALCRACYAKLRRTQLRAAGQSSSQVSKG
ncbi:uncharacterized protein NECHADRAFT_82752 [Fusarium vanettenii 77-13-4]|uniref:Uncharacterized protein n=1 Tax=Fusarium vanettenii (strain ATCC MYA-4622 / CBS 123669 / FGSC 9596 / NRRL 45880 / 77-13-4) TaxID=660122 RepID=C7YWR0_FUSV7|nr:uncharacterized protein NECHADRAFT_82752 [Fusarium vanettenii 77-13-4]EEU43704.1 predicted protein [Fusarium vanettenii 77-13-4]